MRDFTHSDAANVRGSTPLGLKPALGERRVEDDSRAYGDLRVKP